MGFGYGPRFYENKERTPGPGEYTPKALDSTPSAFINERERDRAKGLQRAENSPLLPKRSISMLLERTPSKTTQFDLGRSKSLQGTPRLAKSGRPSTPRAETPSQIPKPKFTQNQTPGARRCRSSIPLRLQERTGEAESTTIKAVYLTPEPPTLRNVNVAGQWPSDSTVVEDRDSTALLKDLQSALCNSALFQNRPFDLHAAVDAVFKLSSSAPAQVSCVVPQPTCAPFPHSPRERTSAFELAAMRSRMMDASTQTSTEDFALYQLDHGHDTHTARETELTTALADVEDYRSRLEETNAHLKALQRHYDDTLDSKDQQIQRSAGMLTVKDEEIASLQSQIENYSTRLEHADNQINALQAEMDKYVGPVQQHVQCPLAVITAKEVEVASLPNAIEDCRQPTEEAEAEVHNKALHCQDEDTVETLQQHVQQCHRLMAEKDVEIAKLQSCVAVSNVQTEQDDAESDLETSGINRSCFKVGACADVSVLSSIQSPSQPDNNLQAHLLATYKAKITELELVIANLTMKLEGSNTTGGSSHEQHDDNHNWRDNYPAWLEELLKELKKHPRFLQRQQLCQ